MKVNVDETQKILFLILPQAATQFLVNLLPEFSVRSRSQRLLDKFEFSHNLFAE